MKDDEQNYLILEFTLRNCVVMSKNNRCENKIRNGKKHTPSYKI